jgi:hypothetical protein
MLSGIIFPGNLTSKGACEAENKPSRCVAHSRRPSRFALCHLLTSVEANMRDLRELEVKTICPLIT